MRLEGWDAVVVLPTTARGLPRAIEAGVEFTPRYSRGALLTVRWCGFTVSVSYPPDTHVRALVLLHRAKRHFSVVMATENSIDRLKFNPSNT